MFHPTFTSPKPAVNSSGWFFELGHLTTCWAVGQLGGSHLGWLLFQHVPAIPTPQLQLNCDGILANGQRWWWLWLTSAQQKIAYIEIKTVFFSGRIPCWWRVLSLSCLQEWDNYNKFIEIHLQTLQKIHMFFRASTHTLPVPLFVTTKMLCAFHFPNRAVLLATLSAIMAGRHTTSCGVIYHFQ